MKRTPPLGATGAVPRGLAWVDLAGNRAAWHPLSYDIATGAITGPRTRGPAVSDPRSGGRFLGRFTDTRAPSPEATVWWIAFLAAVLTVAALWKIPEPTTAGPTITTTGGNGTAAPVSVATSSTVVPVSFLRPAQPGGSVFESNLGRTVLSGLTGIAIVTVLTDLWNASGVNAQALYLVTFIFWFLVLLAVSAVVRGFVEARRSILADQYRPSPGNSADTQHKQHRPFGPTLQVFMDTALNVLLGQNQAESVVWERRYIEHQSALLKATHRIREQVSGTVRDALARAQLPALEERDIRVSVSLLGADGNHAFYISSARNSIGREFGRKTVAMVALTSLQARWYKDTYLSRPPCFISEEPLCRQDGALLTPDTGLSDLLNASAQGISVGSKWTLTVVGGKRSDGTLIEPKDIYSLQTVGDLLRILNASDAFGGGQVPAQFSLDSSGRLLLVGYAPPKASSNGQAKGKESGEEQGSQLDITSLQLTTGAATAAAITLAFTKATMNEVDLFDATSAAAIPGYDAPLNLESHVGPRGAHDYQAFMVLPFPWSRGGTDSNERRAALHISFSRAEYMDALWHGLESSVGTVVMPNYAAHRGLLDARMLSDDALRSVLEQSVRVLSELVQQLNDTLYKSRFGRQI